MATSRISPHQVFLSFKGELRYNFVSYLAKALRDQNIKIFIDEETERGQNLNILFKKIEESKVALVIFSKGYTASDWCLNELVKIKERVDDNKLVAIPIFYMIETVTVKHQTGEFGDVLRKKKPSVGDDQMKKWQEALKSVSDILGITFDGKSSENKFIDGIIKEVWRVLDNIPSEESTKKSLDNSQYTEVSIRDVETENFGLKERFKELKEKVNFKSPETRIVGVVGMHGIGKTTLVKELFESEKSRFWSHGLLSNISDLAQDKKKGLKCLPGLLLKELLPDEDIDEETYESYKTKLLENKVFIVLDGINDKTQIQVLLENYPEWTKTGSKIVIATSDKSLLEDLVHDFYVVPQLNHRDGLKHFHQYAMDGKTNVDKEAFMEVSKEFVHYARGHPLILQLLGEELCGKDMAHWKEKLDTLPHILSPSIQDRILQVTYDELSSNLKEAFLDIACFRSHDLVYVSSLLDSSRLEANTTLKALTDKFLINTFDSTQIEMHDLLYTFANSKAKGKGRHHRDITTMLQRHRGNRNVRVIGIFLDLSHIKRDMTLGRNHFEKMRDLRYFKLYSSHCPQECKPNQKIRIPEELDFPLEQVRCLHWLKYPLEELPPNFNPINLVDLKLPYSKITHIWNNKNAPKLKWVDLNHSSKLNTLSGLSNAKNLQRLNLEGCTALETLDPNMQDMENLVFMNLKGCSALKSFPDIKFVSLKTLILSDCSNLTSFLLDSETLEVLCLNGTAITEIPTSLVKLVKLNLQDCKMLIKLPAGFDKLKDLQELVCSACSSLSSLPDEMKNMKCLQILLLDGTAIKQIPHISSLLRLGLSRNNNISFLDDMSQLSQLKWLDLKYCVNLLSIPKLPTSLQYLDAHGCVSLKTMAMHLPMEHFHSTFIFTNCNKLDRTTKEELTTYAQRKCQLLSDALKSCYEGFGREALFSTCFPGCEVPSWFCHKAVGSVLNLKLPPHWYENRVFGIALCAVVSSPNCQEQISSFSVTCKIKLESKNGLKISFDRLVGRWNTHGNLLDKKASDHLFICYTRCSKNIECFKDQHSGTCTPTEATLEFGVTCEKARVQVLKCGLRLVYASDEPITTKRDNNVDTNS